MPRGHPPFLLAPGEIVLLILTLRIALWIALGWRQLRAEGPPEPDGPGGLPVLVCIEPRESAAQEFRKAA